MSLSISERFKQASAKQWIKATLVTLLLLCFVFWMSNPWLLLLELLVVDIYFTRFIPWTWWRDLKSKPLRGVMEWVDAIIFALVAVYFINLYLFQNFQIPSSSMESTLMVGDHLLVSKVSYGPRTPNTPFSLPLMQHTIPGTRLPSFIGSIQWKSRRLAGLDTVKRGDIVVFNFPAGDTVCRAQEAVSYNLLCFEAGENALAQNGISIDSLWKQGQDVRTLCLGIGREIVHSDPQTYGEIVYRPVDRRENYIKRCVALPGDTVQVINRELYVNGVKQHRLPRQQQYHEVQSRRALSSQKLMDIGFSSENASRAYLGAFQFPSETRYIYLIPMTQSRAAELRKYKDIISVEEHNLSDYLSRREKLFPLGYNLDWTVDNYGPIYIPKKGATVQLTTRNLPLFERVIRNYEGNALTVKDSTIFINGKPATSYTFQQNYYWMMGDNRHNSADSRVWGYVPEDHIVGKPLFVWLSLDKDKGLFSGKIRFSRFFKNAKQ